MRASKRWIGLRRLAAGGTLLLTAVILAGCDGGVTSAGQATLGDAEAVALGVLLADQAGAAADAEMADASASPSLSLQSGELTADVVSRERDFSVTRSCPLGGEVTLAGTATGTLDTETGVATLDAEGMKTHRNCVVEPRGRELTLNAAPGLDVAAHRTWEDRVPVGRQTHTVQGKLNWRLEDGRGGTCEIDLVGEYDADTGVRSVTGEVCGRSIDRSSPTG